MDRKLFLGAAATALAACAGPALNEPLMRSSGPALNEPLMRSGLIVPRMSPNVGDKQHHCPPGSKCSRWTIHTGKNGAWLTWYDLQDSIISQCYFDAPDGLVSYASMNRRIPTPYIEDKLTITDDRITKKGMWQCLDNWLDSRELDSNKMSVCDAYGNVLASAQWDFPHRKLYVARPPQQETVTLDIAHMMRGKQMVYDQCDTARMHLAGALMAEALACLAIETVLAAVVIAGCVIEVIAASQDVQRECSK